MPKPSLPQPLIGQDLDGTVVKSYPTPSTDIQLEALLEGNIDNYVAQLYGTPPPEDANPSMLLVNEMPVDWKFVKRTYMTDRANTEDTYNPSISYDQNADNYPIYTRDYIVRRANYVKKAFGTVLAGIVNSTITAPGSGYSPQTVSVSLSGGTGSGGAVTAIVSNGAVVQLVITNEGNYTVAPALTINDSGGGTGATGMAFVQAVTARGLYHPAVTAVGSGYSSLTTTVALSGGTGSGGAVTAQVNSSGQVYGFVVTNPGSYSVAPSLTVNSSGGGTGATGTIAVEPLAPILISEDYLRQPTEVYDGLYVLVRRVYKLLPGPKLIGAEMNDDCQGAVASTGSQEILSTEPEIVPDSGYLVYEDIPIDANRKTRKITYAEHGFPSLVETYYQPERNGRRITKYYEVVSVDAQSPFFAPGESIEYRRINEWRCLQIHTVWDPVDGYTDRQRAAYSFPILFDVTSLSFTSACGLFGTIKGKRDVLAFFYVEHEWFDSFPGAQSYLILEPQMHLAGIAWPSYLETINDAGPLVYSGGCTATYDFVASSPNLSSYNALIGGGPQIMSENCVLDEDGRFHRETYTLNLI